ncbi:M48 family metallopeptidase [Glaciecola sp. XM2]|jgi:predicted Zn-dependent protease|uniref:M48 family metallopeptidase n=1 Tax=Glaciecola sp. XM2 TaxID=1914931 RepID=UPI001BDF3D90|nr:M48 family metallopeptidase [Glaciecola sp. XM2]MBT1450452.1 M48 family metallopeptidase [Glaciecola sp. XM2]
MRKKLTTALIALSAAMMLSACTTSPTGRSQVLLYSDAQLAQSGAQAFAGMKQEIPISSTAVTNNFVQCIANNIIQQLGPSASPDDWEVVVFDSDQVNAFALPGKKIGVYTGLLKVAQNQDQVAAVIGHEVGHVLAQHGNERMSQSTLIGISQEAVSVALQSNNVAQSGAIMSAFGLGAQLGVTLPFSRAHETEADIIGLDLMARAGFDPRQSINLWQNMNKASGGNRPLEMLSTHPAPDTRIANLRANMGPALTTYNAVLNKPKCE